jgi:hypothetical protein
MLHLDDFLAYSEERQCFNNAFSSNTVGRAVVSTWGVGKRARYSVDIEIPAIRELLRDGYHVIGNDGRWVRHVE